MHGETMKYIGTGLLQVFQFSHQYRSINVQYAPFPTVRAEILQLSVILFTH